MALQDFLSYVTYHDRVCSEPNTTSLKIKFEYPPVVTSPTIIVQARQLVMKTNNCMSVYIALPVQLVLPSLRTFVSPQNTVNTLNVSNGMTNIGLCSSSIMVNGTSIESTTMYNGLLASNISSMSVCKVKTPTQLIPLVNNNTTQVKPSNPLICTRGQLLADSKLSYYTIAPPLFGALNNVYLEVTAGDGVYISFKNTLDTRVDIVSVTGMLACLTFDSVNSCITGVPFILGVQTIIIMSNSNLVTTLTLDVLPSNVKIT
jgi:hypothetical protein